MARTLLTTSVGVLPAAVCAWGESTTPSVAALAAGTGRDIAAARCVSCHDASRLVTPGYNRAGWADVIERMTKLGVVVSDAERAPLTDYLVRSFPPQPQAAAKVIAGSASVTFHEWSVQTWPIPSGGGVVRNMMATHDHRLVLTESGAGKLALVDVR
jgi:hypothetical protein